MGESTKAAAASSAASRTHATGSGRSSTGAIAPRLFFRSFTCFLCSTPCARGVRGGKKEEMLKKSVSRMHFPLFETCNGPGIAVFSARVPYDKAHIHACTGKSCRAVCSCDWMLLCLCALGLKDGAIYFNQARCIFACWDKTDRPWSIMFADERQVTCHLRPGSHVCALRPGSLPPQTTHAVAACGCAWCCISFSGAPAVGWPCSDTTELFLWRTCSCSVPGHCSFAPSRCLLRRQFPWCRHVISN